VPVTEFRHREESLSRFAEFRDTCDACNPFSPSCLGAFDTMLCRLVPDVQTSSCAEIPVHSGARSRNKPARPSVTSRTRYRELADFMGLSWASRARCCPCPCLSLSSLPFSILCLFPVYVFTLHLGRAGIVHGNNKTARRPCRSIFENAVT